MKRSGTPCHRRIDAIAVALSLGLLGLPACVTRGTHLEMVADRDRLLERSQMLQDRVELLSASTESLSAERVSLIDEMEDLRSTREILESDVHKLQRTESILSEALRTREEELATHKQQIHELQGTYKGLVEDLEKELSEGYLEIEELREGIRLNLTQDVLFASGSAEVGDAGIAVLRKVAARIESVAYRVEVQGHTDSVPVSGRLATRFASNWELAGARASRVVRVLADAGIAPARMTAVSFGEFRPVDSNDTNAGRARNRRIEIRLIPVPPEAAPEAAS